MSYAEDPLNMSWGTAIMPSDRNGSTGPLLDPYTGLPVNNELTELRPASTRTASTPDPTIAHEILAQLKLITKSVNDIKVTLGKQGEQIDLIAANQNAKNPDEEDISEVARSLGIPVTTKEDFERLDRDKDALSSLKKYLLELGGLDLQTALRGFLRATMTDQFVAHFLTWSQGDESSGKIHFQETNVNLTFFGACRKMNRLKTPDVDEYEKNMKKNIKNAIQRHYMASKADREKSISSRKKKVAETAEERRKRYDEA